MSPGLPLHVARRSLRWGRPWEALDCMAWERPESHLRSPSREGSAWHLPAHAHGCCISSCSLSSCSPAPGLGEALRWQGFHLIRKFSRCLVLSPRLLAPHLATRRRLCGGFCLLALFCLGLPGIELKRPAGPRKHQQECQEDGPHPFGPLRESISGRAGLAVCGSKSR